MLLATGLRTETWGPSKIRSWQALYQSANQWRALYQKVNKWIVIHVVRKQVKWSRV
jgi:hypothetical protein